MIIKKIVKNIQVNEKYILKYLKNSIIAVITQLALFQLLLFLKDLTLKNALNYFFQNLAIIIKKR